MAKCIAILLAVLAIFPATVHSFTSYDNEFVDPGYILSKNFDNTTVDAQSTILLWADQFAAGGPWSVMNKSIVPPTGDKHTYMSWAPYSWPNCTGVGNTTELSPQQIWVTCPYYTRDGQFNPDRLLVNDTGSFNAMADAVFFNAIAWAINGSDHFQENVANFIDTWFINPATSMLPNLDYAQMSRGPNGQVGTHTGVLDLKSMAKVASGILILREGNSTAWTSQLDVQMTNWTNVYIGWMSTASLALQEKAALNNHGSYYFNQMAGLQLIVNNKTGAAAILQEYFSGIYQGQIDGNGEQPEEAVRTHPYHYRCYNLAAMITNARLAKYSGIADSWNITTKNGGTIQKACDFTMTVHPADPTAEDPSELYPLIGAIASTYGDPGAKYTTFLKDVDVSYPSEPWFLWDQPLSDSGWVANNSHIAGNPSAPNNSGGKNNCIPAISSQFGGLFFIVVWCIGGGFLLL